MQTVSKYGAADAEAQAPAAPEEKPLGRAKVALICVAAALSGAAVASVARVRTRTYAAELFGGVGYHMGGKNLQPPPTTLKKPCYLEDDCSETETCYVKLKDDGTTKHKCAAKGSLGSNWIIIESVRSKKKPGADSLSGGGPCHGFKGKTMCAQGMDPQCDENGNYLGSSKCNFCITSKGQAHRGKIDKCPQEVIDNL